MAVTSFHGDFLFDIVRLLEDNRAKHLAVQRDPAEHAAYLNTGLIVFRNSPAARLVFEKILGLGAKKTAWRFGQWRGAPSVALNERGQVANCFHEQSALELLLGVGVSMGVQQDGGRSWDHYQVGKSRPRVSGGEGSAGRKITRQG